MHPAEKIGKKLLVVVCYVSSHRYKLLVRVRLSGVAISSWSETLCAHAILNYRLPLEDGGNLHLIGDHGLYQFA